MSTVPPDRWRRIASLFDEAVKLSVERRAAFVQAECGDDPDLKAEVVRLLESADLAEGFLESPLFSQVGPLVRQAIEDLAPDTAEKSPADPSDSSTITAGSSASASESIGPYRLLRKIGEGGMGEVWLAEQTEPVRRKVALKLIKAGMDTKQVMARFEAERQALALMDHPAITKVFEAGETPRGHPYFAMEYVAGEPITKYCDRHRLDMPERLDLFARVCDGVQHAHQKGVIHRDLKPSNVLVAIQDDKPVPKIIDFGVAKATAQRLTEKTIFSALGLLIGTPEYMSPEQAEMTGLDVDTRTDVYALGVMLYELLTGALPFETKELRQAGYDEIRRRIREVDPPRPSTRISTLGERATDAARNRRTEPRQLAGRLRGDLDWIVMKALEKDRTRRYGSPSDLAADLGRHLHHEPVLAGPPSASYRTRKFIRRHRFGVTVAAVAVAGLAAFAGTTLVQAERIKRERDRANREAEVSKRVSEFMTSLFEVSDPSEARGNSVTAREILDKGAERIDKELRNSPVIQAQLMHTMGLVYSTLGLYEKAEQLFAGAVELREKALGAVHPDTLDSMIRQGLAVYYCGRPREAESLLREALGTSLRVLGPEHADTAHAMAALGAVCRTLGRYDEAEKLVEQALENRRRALGPEHTETMQIMSNLARVYQDQRRYDQARKTQVEVVEMQRRVLGSDHPRTLASQMSLATIDWRMGRPDEAERIDREVLDIQRRVLGSEHHWTLQTMHGLANALTGQSRYPEAETIDREVFEIERRVLGPDHPDTLDTMNNLADDLLQQSRYDEAERLRDKVLEIRRRVLGPTSPRVAEAQYQLACVSAKRGNRTQALVRLRLAIGGGYEAPDLGNDADLRSLRGSPEFEQLVAAARKNLGKQSSGER